MGKGDQMGSGSGTRVHGDRNVVIGNVSDSTVSVSHNEVAAPPVNRAELEARITAELAALRDAIETHARDECKADALRKVDELDQALKHPDTDLDTMGSIKRWFRENLPAFASTVTSIVAGPIAGQLAKSAGDAIAAEWKRRFRKDGG